MARAQGRDKLNLGGKMSRARMSGEGEKVSRDGILIANSAPENFARHWKDNRDGSE